MSRTKIISFLFCLSIIAVACQISSSSSGAELGVANYHLPANSIDPKDLSNYVIAYCWRPADAKPSKIDPRQTDYYIAISSGDGRGTSVLSNYAPYTNGDYYMFGCVSDPTALDQNVGRLVWQPHENRLSFVSGLDIDDSDFQFVSVTEKPSPQITDLGDMGITVYNWKHTVDPYANYGQYFINPRNIFWSPDGDKFATLASDTGATAGILNIWTYELSTGTIRNITGYIKLGDFVQSAVWSKHGDKLAIGYGSPDSGVGIATYGTNNYIEVTSRTQSELSQPPYAPKSIFDIFRAFLDKRYPLAFTAYLVFNSGPVWIDNDQKIIFTATDQNKLSTLFIVNSDGTNLEKLIPGLQGIVGLPKLSPDETQLAFIRYPSWTDRSRVEISVLNLSSMQLKSLIVVNAPQNGKDLLISGIDWSPDGKYLAFSSNHTGESAIYIITSDGSAWLNLTKNVNGDAVSPAWMP